ncbi:hypothetical protein MPH_04950 [Macrophomina phaseolina MS6]|uniref:Uncharacterized protein n=1 Tax=Macrophomina phaseolina (strain MS6) TaxID=1126212 RepID=K2RSU6_MACPH|nr:hypothetical protein MPH_04950 [Macrophomina phaseolina MS6]
MAGVLVFENRVFIPGRLLPKNVPESLFGPGCLFYQDSNMSFKYCKGWLIPLRVETGGRKKVCILLRMCPRWYSSRQECAYCFFFEKFRLFFNVYLLFGNVYSGFDGSFKENDGISCLAMCSCTVVYPQAEGRAENTVYIRAPTLFASSLTGSGPCKD